jgi:hypothetical protein
VGPGDIVVLDQLDLDRATADALVKAEVAAVVNASVSISGRFPNLGPEILVAAGIPLVDDVGGEVLRAVKDGSKVRIDDGVVYTGEREIARGTEQTRESVADQMIEAKAGMSAQLEAFSANTMEFLRRERTLILDGVGVPSLRVPLAQRHVLVIAPGNGHVEDLKRLKKYIAEHRHPYSEESVYVATGSAFARIHGIAFDPEAHGSEAKHQAEGGGKTRKCKNRFEHYPVTSPEKPMNANDIIPAVIRAIAAPRKGTGTSAAAMRSRMAEKAISTSEKPAAAPKPKTAASARPWLSCTLSSATPSTAQFVVISGR